MEVKGMRPAVHVWFPALLYEIMAA